MQRTFDAQQIMAPAAFELGRLPSVLPRGGTRYLADNLVGCGALLADPSFEARLADLGFVPMTMTPADFGKFIADETEKWRKMVGFSGMGQSDRDVGLCVKSAALALRQQSTVG